MSHPFNYEHHNRRKARVSSRSSPRDVREREHYFQSRSADQFDEPQNFHQNHQIVKHEVASNYGDEDEKIEDESAEDLRKSSTADD